MSEKIRLNDLKIVEVKDLDNVFNNILKGQNRDKSTDAPASDEELVPLEAVKELLTKISNLKNTDQKKITLQDVTVRGFEGRYSDSNALLVALRNELELNHTLEPVTFSMRQFNIDFLPTGSTVLNWAEDQNVSGKTRISANILLPDNTLLWIYHDLPYGTDENGKIVRDYAAANPFKLGNSGRIVLYATDSQTASKWAKALVSTLRITIPSEVTKPRFRFWTMTANGPSSFTRSLDCPEWDEIEENYCTDVKEHFTELVDKFPSGRSGLLLWTGVPGTGKTTALRALMRSWQEKCDIHVITDPEVFLNQPTYLNSVMEGSYDGKETMVILEDAGELLRADAAARAGQALSRLLNATDGLLGQGLNMKILITTNEEITQLHPAVSRPGRCISQVEFLALTPKEAKEWYKKRDATLPAELPSWTIAQLFAGLTGDPLATKQLENAEKKSARKIGFSCE